MKPELFNYGAKLIRVMDGDTIEVTLDLGFGISVDTIVRLNGIDTPEIHSLNIDEKNAATVAKNVLLKKLTNVQLILKTIKYGDKYGRYLADVYTDTGDYVNDFMVQYGVAHKYDGGTKQEWVATEFALIITKGVVL